MNNSDHIQIFFPRMERAIKSALNVRRLPIKSARFISNLTGVQSRILEKYNKEYDLKARDFSIGEYATQFKGKKKFNTSEDYRTWYIVTRILKPEIVVETGVLHGFSSLSFLLALEENEKGYLYSIDLPSPNLLSLGKKPGWVVPEYLTKRWYLSFGKSSELLLDLLKEVKTVDIFLHDGEHSYENMLWEYKTVWRYLKEGGLLLSHDITKNSAFRDFTKNVAEQWYYTLGNTAGIKRTV